MMRKINQDGLENVFLLMRHKGGFCNNPRKFMSAFNNIALCCVNNVDSNCEVVDWNQLILDVIHENFVRFLLLYATKMTNRKNLYFQYKMFNYQELWLKQIV